MNELYYYSIVILAGSEKKERWKLKLSLCHLHLTKTKCKWNIFCYSIYNSNNPDCHYIHFELGRKDNESGGLSRVKVIMKSLILWNRILNSYPEALVHYNFPLSKMSILRDPLFMMIARWKRRKMVIHLHGRDFLTTPHIPKYLKCILQSVFSFSFPCIVLSYLEKKLVVESSL